MKRRNRAVLSLLLATVSMGVASASISLAWFTTSPTVKVAGLDVNIDADRNLQVSLDPTKFEDHKFSDNSQINLSLRDSKTSATVFKPVSSMYTFDEDFTSKNEAIQGSVWQDTSSEYYHEYEKYHWYRNKEEKPYFADNYNAYDRKVPEVPLPAEGGYFEQTIYLLADDNVYVTLDSTKTGYVANQKQLDKYGQEAFDGLFHSLRMSFLKCYDMDPDSEGDASYDKSDYNYSIVNLHKDGTPVEFAGRMSANDDDTFDYWMNPDTGELKEILYGVIDESTRDNAVYGDPVANKTEESGKRDSFDSETGDGVRPLMDISDVKCATEHSLFPDSTKEYNSSTGEEVELTPEERETYEQAEELAYPDDKFTLKLYRNRPVKLVLDIYMEGWDRACVNNTMGYRFTTNISFKIAREMNI